MKTRLIITAALLAFAMTVGFVANTVQPIVGGEAAVNQLQDSDASYYAAKVGMGITPFIQETLTFGVLVAVVCIWVGPIRRSLKSISLFALAAFLIFGWSPRAYCYYDKQDLPEYVTVGPNQSAFLLPVQGANNKSQAQFNSSQYLQDNKVAAKRIQIPHVSIDTRGLTSLFNQVMYIPAAQLYIVDRTPYMREWTAKSTTGTSAADQSFHFESAESLNLGADITISAEVREEDAALFFYHYGSDQNAANPNDPYPSVVQGRSLAEVMDTVVRGKVQAVLSREFGARKMVDALAQKSQIISIVEKEVTDTFAKTGITINYVGYASSLTEDPDVQAAINGVFVAQEKAQELGYLQAVIAVQQQQAQINLTNAYAQTLPKLADKWNGALPQLPNWVVLPADINRSLSSWWSGTGAALGTPAKP